MTARVTMVTSSSTRGWTIAVQRRTEWLGDSIEQPPVDDVPADIRAALNAWLNPPTNTAPCSSYAPTGPDADDGDNSVACRHCGWIRGAHVIESEKGLDGCWNFQPVNPLSTKTIEPDRGCRNCGRPYREHV